MAQWNLIEFNCADGYSYSLHYGGKMQYKERLPQNEPNYSVAVKTFNSHDFVQTR